MRKALRVLLVEDSDLDSRLVQEELRAHGFDLSCERVQTEPAFRAQLESKDWDVIIADYRLPRFSALNALRIVQEKQREVPFIIVSGTIGEEVAVAAMKAGAHDYVMKGKLARLVPAVERELRDAEVRHAKLKAEDDSRFQAHLLNAVGQAVLATDASGQVTYWNRAAGGLYGWSNAEALGKKLAELIQPTGPGPNQAAIWLELKEGRSWFGEMTMCRKGGEAITALVTNSPVFGPGNELAGMIQVATDVTERKRAELELADSRQQLRALAAKLQSVREEERKGLSRDIHDELGQVLTGLKMELAWMRSRLNTTEPVPRQALLDKISVLGSQIDASADTIRKLCAELRPGILDDLGLAAAIEWQAREFTKRTGIKSHIKNPIEDPPLGPEENTAVFRIFQEILTNVARHAEATQVTVDLTFDERKVVLEASDNGRGIRGGDLTGAKSLGLLGMRERAMALGGSIDFQSAPGQGTTVRLSIPLQKKPVLQPETSPRAWRKSRRKKE